MARSRKATIAALSWGAGGFVLCLLVTAPMRGEPPDVMASYVGLLVVFATAFWLRDRRPEWAGALSSLGPFALVTILAWARGGIVSPPAMVSYITLVVLAALCWGSRGAFLLSVLGSLTVGCFALVGPHHPPEPMGHFQTWAEISFQLVIVAAIAHVALRTVEQAVVQALRLESEEQKTRLVREALEVRVSHSQSLEAVGRLAGGVAHDFNNLLTVILGEAEFLLEGGVNPATREGVERIEGAAQRAAKLTHQLLAVGRKQVLSPVVLEPAHVVTELHGLMSRIVPSGVKLRLQIEDDTGHVLADEARLEQVLINLVTNASDAMSGEGEIVLATRNLSLVAPDLSFNSPVPPGEYVELSVRDSGAGMSAEVQARIFEPFFTTKSIGLGTGLGLATVLGIVTQSGGYIGVTSSLNQGSTFRVLLPRSFEACTTHRPPSFRRLTRAAHILLVEDEDDVRLAIRRTLESLGHTVVEAKSASEALMLAADAAWEFDLLVSDVVMPGLTGPALAERMLSANPELKVLFVSGYAAEQLPMLSSLGPRTEYLPKPLSRAGLGAKLWELLESPPGVH